MFVGPLQCTQKHEAVALVLWYVLFSCHIEYRRSLHCSGMWGLKKYFPRTQELSIMESLCAREVACLLSDRLASNLNRAWV